MNSLESQGMPLKNEVELFLLLPENELSKYIKSMYTIVYPQNCTVIYTDACARSAAKCIEKAAGNYVTLLGAGDIYSDNALRKVYDYFEFAKGNVDVAGVKVVSGDKKYENYNKNFSSGNTNLHLLEKYSAHPPALDGLFIKSNLAKEKIKRQSGGLDPEVFVMDVICRKNTLGCVGAATIKISREMAEAVTVEHFGEIVLKSLRMLREEYEAKGFVYDYLQDSVARRMVRAFNDSEEIMDAYHHPAYDYSEVWKDFSALMKYIDDRIILALSTTRFHRMFMLYHKYERYCGFDQYFNDAVMCYACPTYKLSSFPARFDLLGICDGRLIMEGLMHFPACIDMDNLKIIADINGERHEIEMVERCTDRYIFEKTYLYERGFKIDLPLKRDEYKIKLACRINNVICYNAKFEFMEICSISGEVKEDYYFKDNYAVTLSENSFLCRKCSEEERQELEENLQNAVRIAENDRADEIIEVRDFYWENYNKKEKQVWLITDRPDRADDNAEAFFRYMAGRAEEDIDLYFVLSRSSSSYEELSTVGRVIEPFSSEHLKLQTVADYVISSQMGEAVYNPFNDDVKYFRGIFMNPRFVFLQHGVINNDHGKVMGKYGRNFYGFITSAEDEYNYMLEPKFHYTPKEVWLTGLPRWDLLYHEPKKKITIMPTWRMFLTDRVFDEESQTKIWKVKDDFIESRYFNFYNDLINDEKLLDAADKYGYEICFMPHVMFLKQAGKFHTDGRAVVYDYEKRYREIYAESDLIVTDYSSAVFDFVYMRKPILYCQFDKEEFYAGHSYKKGYFDHERDGFGEVAYDLKDIVRLMIEYMSDGCLLKAKYRERIERFFGFNDRNCCKRVYEKIRGLEDGDF